ncbi:hypothetical protein EVAR_32585_1 [Eumeta japonica]|uniref:Uncharacterized protein n=1 Tax=Eumeta variegata TaxID=151549 RepID=A0A4C1VRW4_EUMVA|nr:hypothetical protein EVAR_32585_1 [Eumeta japonica]
MHWRGGVVIEREGMRERKERRRKRKILCNNHYFIVVYRSREHMWQFFGYFEKILAKENCLATKSILFNHLSARQSSIVHIRSMFCCSRQIEISKTLSSMSLEMVVLVRNPEKYVMYKFGPATVLLYAPADTNCAHRCPLSWRSIRHRHGLDTQAFVSEEKKDYGYNINMVYKQICTTDV